MNKSNIDEEDSSKKLIDWSSGFDTYNITIKWSVDNIIQNTDILSPVFTAGDNDELKWQFVFKYKGFVSGYKQNYHEFFLGLIFLKPNPSDILYFWDACILSYVEMYFETQKNKSSAIGKLYGYEYYQNNSISLTCYIGVKINNFIDNSKVYLNKQNNDSPKFYIMDGSLKNPIRKEIPFLVKHNDVFDYLTRCEHNLSSNYEDNVRKKIGKLKTFKNIVRWINGPKIYNGIYRWSNISQNPFQCKSPEFIVGSNEIIFNHLIKHDPDFYYFGNEIIAKNNISKIYWRAVIDHDNIYNFDYLYIFQDETLCLPSNRYQFLENSFNVTIHFFIELTDSNKYSTMKISNNFAKSPLRMSVHKYIDKIERFDLEYPAMQREVPKKTNINKINGTISNKVHVINVEWNIGKWNCEPISTEYKIMKENVQLRLLLNVVNNFNLDKVPRLTLEFENINDIKYYLWQAKIRNKNYPAQLFGQWICNGKSLELSMKDAELFANDNCISIICHISVEFKEKNLPLNELCLKNEEQFKESAENNKKSTNNDKNMVENNKKSANNNENILQNNQSSNKSNEELLEEISILRKRLSDLESSQNDKKLPDCNIKSGVNLYPVHKYFLAAKSQVFKNMFEGNQKMNLIIINELNDEAMKILLYYFYTGELNKLNDYELIPNLLTVANKYQIEDLYSKLEQCINKNLNVKNAIEALVLANDYNFEELKNTALDLVIKNVNEFFSPEMQTFMKSKPKLFSELLQRIRNVQK